MANFRKAKMLDYENQLFLEMVEEDGLVVMAKGLGIERLFLNLIKIYLDPGNLVLVLGTTINEEEYFTEQLENENVTTLPKIMKAECSPGERHGIYMQGGVLFVTSRILIVDMLSDRVPIDLITGILVYRAHRVSESAQEAFILRLYRQKNKTGFIKAFSEAPHAFTTGFCQVERVMRNLFIRKLQLWPRFHATVQSSLEDHKPEVIEMHVQVTPAMRSIQTALLDLISICVKELKFCNQTLDTDELTVENAMSKSFDTIVRIQLEPIWNQLSFKSKQLVDDLKTLRNLLVSLTQYDCVTFYNLVYSLRSNEKAFHESNWLFLESAESLFLQAKQRVFGTKNLTDAKKKSDGSDGDEPAPREIQPEESPKWVALVEVLKEIKEEQVSSDELSGGVLIIAVDNQTCSLLKGLLCSSSDSLLRKLYNRTGMIRGGKVETTSSKKSDSNVDEVPNVVKAKKKKLNDDEVTLTQMMKKTDTETDSSGDESKNEDESVSPQSETDLTNIVTKDPVIIHSLKDNNHCFGLVRTLNELKPGYVIMYDADIEAVRRLEVFKSQNPKHRIRVYFLLYTGTAEEQRYLTILRKEKDAFEFLIKEKATMVIPEEREGKLDGHPDLIRDSLRATDTVNPTNTRAGGSCSSDKEKQQIVLVDSREFRSDLPSLIHRRGIDITPVTLEVGDYILTPDICVERKSVSDLIGSLNSGRLYNQAQAMTRYYKRPMLLIEFDQNKPFTIQNKNYISANVSSNDTTSKLLLLTIHFPRLRILWCASPYATAELFEELKAGRDQPDVSRAMAVTQAELAQTGNVHPTDKYSSGPQDFLLRLPGVNTKNCYSLMNKAKTIADLSTTDVDELGSIMGNTLSAQLLWDSFHKPVKELQLPRTTNQKATKISKKR